MCDCLLRMRKCGECYECAPEGCMVGGLVVEGEDRVYLCLSECHS